MRLRDCHFAPERPAHFTRQISILHPGYAQGDNIMLVLPCLDAVDRDDVADDDKASANPASKSSQPRSYGVHYEIVLVACQIITENSFDNAYLSYVRPGNDRVGMDLDGILTKSDYYLHVVQDVGVDSKSYAVTPNFQQWRFPDQLPDNWRSLQSTQLDPYQRSCIMSGSQKTVDAHLVPRGQDEWYEANGMRHYSLRGRSVSDSEDNSCRMRPDLHRIFDDRAFALIPQPDGHGKQHLTVHFFSIFNTYTATTLDIHNRKVPSLGHVRPEFLFSRFAYAVFARLKEFILGGIMRKVAITECADDPSGTPTWITRVANMDNTQRKGLYGGGGSRGSSPTKRSRNTESRQGEDEAGRSNPSDLDPDPGLDSHLEDSGKSGIRSWVLANAATLDDFDEGREFKRRRVSRAVSPPPLTRSHTSETPSRVDNNELEIARSQLSRHYHFPEEHDFCPSAKTRKATPTILIIGRWDDEMVSCSLNICFSQRLVRMMDF